MSRAGAIRPITVSKRPRVRCWLGVAGGIGGNRTGWKEPSTLPLLPTAQTAPIAIYGATGYTGRLVAAELAANGADFVLAGRDAAKLEALAERGRRLADRRRRARSTTPTPLRRRSSRAPR